MCLCVCVCVCANRREAAAAAGGGGVEPATNQNLLVLLKPENGIKILMWRGGVGAGRTLTPLQPCSSTAGWRHSTCYLVHVTELMVIGVIIVAPVYIIHRLRFDIHHLSKPITGFCTPATARNN